MSDGAIGGVAVRHMDSEDELTNINEIKRVKMP